LPVRKGILAARPAQVKAGLLIRRCGRSAAMSDCSENKDYEGAGIG
jgi:hypothetical protein